MAVGNLQKVLVSEAEALPEAQVDVRALVLEHGAFVYRALRHLGIRDADLHDETQEVFIVVHRKRSGLAQIEKLRSWLYTICAHRAMQYRRTLARGRELPTEVVPEPLEPQGSLPDATLQARDDERLSRWVVDQLDDERRLVFVLHDIEELPMHEIVKIAGCPLKTGYSRLASARERVAAILVRAKAKGWL